LQEVARLFQRRTPGKRWSIDRASRSSVPPASGVNSSASLRVAGLNRRDEMVQMGGVEFRRAHGPTRCKRKSIPDEGDPPVAVMTLYTPGPGLSSHFPDPLSGEPRRRRRRHESPARVSRRGRSVLEIIPGSCPDS